MGSTRTHAFWDAGARREEGMVSSMGGSGEGDALGVPILLSAFRRRLKRGVCASRWGLLHGPLPPHRLRCGLRGKRASRPRSGAWDREETVITTLGEWITIWTRRSIPAMPVLTARAAAEFRAVPARGLEFHMGSAACVQSWAACAGLGVQSRRGRTANRGAGPEAIGRVGCLV